MFTILTNKKENEKSTSKRKPSLASWLFFVYFLILIYITLFAWNYGSSFGPLAPGGRNYNIHPFMTIYRISVYGNWQMIFKILIGNILLFVPFGLLFPLFIERIQRIKKKVSVFLIFFTGMYVSFMIELTQFAFTNRVANVDDIILNSIGALVGAVLYRIFIRLC